MSGSISWGVADATGRLLRRETFEAPYCSMIHDFMVTEHYVLIPVLPLTGDGRRAMKGGPVFAWEPEKPAMVGVMQRDRGVASLRWFATDAAYFFHVMNAYEVAGTIVGDVMKYSAPPLFPNPDGRPGAVTDAHLERWTFDLSGTTNTIRRTALDDRAGEFPRFDDRFSGRAYRHGWITSEKGRLGSEEAFGGITHLDLNTGARATFVLPDGDVTSEAVFVPRDSAAAEGDGWLLAVAYRAREDRSDVIVLDAQDIAAGPIATAALPRRVPFGFHGNWVGSDVRA